MAQTANPVPIYQLRTRPKDIGVALVVLVALALGLGLRFQTERQTRAYADPNSPLRLSYPARWVAGTTPDGLFQATDPATDSTFKTTLTVESRGLDPASPPTVQTLIDRRVMQQGALTGFHFLDEADATVNGAKGARLDYAYVAQPLDTPRRAALPVVVRAREYILVGRDRVYYLTLVAPQDDFADASGQFDRILQTAQVP